MSLDCFKKFNILGAGLYYLAEIVEEYASTSKKIIFYAIAVIFN